jgi:hypothetical protein
VEDLEETARFSLAWLPGPFIAAEVTGRVLERLHRALVPGGWLIFGLHERAPGPIEQALASLRIARNGGHNWTRSEVEELLRAFDFEMIEPFSGALSVELVAGRRRVCSVKRLDSPLSASGCGHQIKTQCLLKRNEYHTTAWIDSEVTKLGWLVEIPDLGGLWEIVEIYPHRLTDTQLTNTQEFGRDFPATHS